MECAREEGSLEQSKSVTARSTLVVQSLYCWNTRSYRVDRLLFSGGYLLGEELKALK